MRHAIPLLLALAPALAAQDEAAVLAQFKTDAKLVVTNLKQDTLAPKDALLDAIGEAQAAIEAAGDAVLAAETLADAVHDYTVTVRGLLAQASLDLEGAWLAALDALAEAGPLNGVYPAGLVNGDGGRLDDTRDEVTRLLAKLAKTINKRLDKAEKAADKAGVGLLAAVTPLAGLNDSSSDENLALGSFPPLTIDGVVSVSTLAAAGDGHVWILGSTNTPADTVEVEIVAGLVALDSDTSGAAQAVWMVALDGDKGDLPEGNFVVFASLGGAGAQVTRSFAIR